MLKRVLVVCLAAILYSSLIPLSIMWDKDGNRGGLQVRSGVLDLSQWNNKKQRIVKLDGQWEFYWKRLLTPESFQSTTADKPEADAFMKVPSQWNNRWVNGEYLDAYGYATYRMVLKNLPVGGVFALKKANVRFSSAIYVNGHKLLEDGKPSANASDYKYGNMPQIGFFQADRGDVEIIVQAANYDYVNAGIPLSLLFGEQSAMLDMQQKTVAREFAVLAILGGLALLFLICFVAAALYFKKDYTLLVFSGICVLYALYNGLNGERALTLLLPELSFEVIYKAKDILSLVCIAVLTVFFYQLQKSIISLKLMQLISAVMGISILFTAILPIRDYLNLQTYVIAIYEVLIVWLLIKIALMYIRSDKAERAKSFMLFMIILPINLYSLDIILFALSYRENLWLSQFYIVAFTIIVIFLIVLRFFEAYRTVDEMKNQLLRMDKIKDDFLSNTSHELKTPLNAIVNITDTLLQGVAGPITGKQARNLGIVLGSGRKLSLLVNDLLDYSKIKHGDIALFRQSLDLRAAVNSIIRVHSFLLGGKEIKLENRVPESFPSVYADGNRLSQILHNLIGNAIKFTDFGEVAVTAGVIGDMAEIRVSDTGIGIASSMHERIFKAYDQGDESIALQHGGTGLGLSITRTLVELHGGKISVESSPGLGSVFTITIPLFSGAVTDSAIGESWLMEDREFSMPDAGSLQVEYPIRIPGKIDEPILVVDDDYANLQSMINLFALEGYTIVVVNRGQLAWDELARNPDYFLVILDITMPDMSGFELLQKIRERFSPSELPVLMLTAKNRVAEMKLSMENGANDFVGKPFEAEELMARVRSLTRLKASVKNAKAAEIAFLRSQIKPHFLYNALNSIAELCVDEPEQAEQLTLQLSQYLRSSFDFKQLDSLTTLDNELKLVEAYVRIEKARFGDRLRVIYDIDANPAIRIPPLILQPLVENAIRHGLMSNQRGERCAWQ
ncbi:ATP-binding protein [Cohnella faecalis]|uniref:histidine kinase n=1 Tax=Cohnella faecalis TaxID=2315694 RepID=A0A398CBZ3_9BACL|nr:ATP-binding protein [Cohnella faecalis]RIE00676.1 response regulator [Cohnella faecalis]